MRLRKRKKNGNKVAEIGEQFATLHCKFFEEGIDRIPLLQI
jgi:hypothetical protein